MPARVNQLDIVAIDLAQWIEEVSDEAVESLKGGAAAPFAARLTEAQKIAYYTTQLFNPDGTPNPQGRDQQLARLGPRGFRLVYDAVIKANPGLRIPPPPDGTPNPSELGGLPQGAPMAPMLPPGMPPPGMPPPGMPIPAMAQGGIVTEPTVALIGEAGPEAVVPLGPQPGDAGMNLPRYEPPPHLAAAPVSPPPISPWDDIIRPHAGDLADNPQFIRTVAAAARAESSDNPQAYQIGYKPDDPRTHKLYGGRGLWQFDINPGAKGHGVPEEQLMDPAYQASVIVPEYVQNYKRVTAEIAAGKRKPMTEAELASLVAGMTELPDKWDNAASPARRNYVRAYNELNAQA